MENQQKVVNNLYSHIFILGRKMRYVHFLLTFHFEAIITTFGVLMKKMRFYTPNFIGKCA